MSRKKFFKGFKKSAIVKNNTEVTAELNAEATESGVISETNHSDAVVTAENADASGAVVTAEFVDAPEAIKTADSPVFNADYRIVIEHDCHDGRYKTKAYKMKEVKFKFFNLFLIILGDFSCFPCCHV